MDLGLKGKKVIINGGSGGLGKAALELYAAEGCDIAFFSRDEAKVNKAADDLRKHGGKVIGEVVDINDHEAYKAWLTSACERLGGCDIFIHTASSSGAQGTGDWDMTFRIDMMGAVIGCETLEEALKASSDGNVLLMSSTAAVETFLVPQAFNAIKAAMITYGKQLSQAWGPEGVRVNLVSPGPIAYPGGNWEAIKDAMPELYDATEAQMALGRFGNPGDVARSMVFLTSPASSYTTGVNLVIDGGYTKRVQF